MSLYVDSSALLKLYVSEPESAMVRELVASADPVVTCRVSAVEVRRNLSRLLSPIEASLARAAFLADLTAFAIVEIDAVTCERAAEIAEQTGVRSLDSIHLAAAGRALGHGAEFLTFDLRQARAARNLEMVVTGV